MTAQVNTDTLIDNMRSARQRTLELIDGLTQEQLIGPKLAIVNPMLWEIGHVAWFYEEFILRREYGASPLLDRGDALYDSISIAHDTRWDLPLYTLDEILDYMARVLDTTAGRLKPGLATERDSFLYQFTVFHEDMHDEAFTWARQTLAYPTPTIEPDGPRANHASVTGGLDGDVNIPGGTFALGSPPEAPFLFDNEKWSHPVTVAPFRMARAPVTNAAFAAFVEDGGYANRALWSDDGWAWREKEQARHPVYWREDKSGGWEMRRFEAWHPLAPDQPVIHVNWYEADAWCRWAGRRLPSEAEWEFAATMRPDEAGGLVKARYPWGDATPDATKANLDGFALGCVDVADHAAGDNAWGCRQMLGNIWEWTADRFGPFPGFAPDDYKEYSEPLFGDTCVLRGGAWTTRSRMATSTYRNYFGPERRDVFAGFRTCVL
ncbi:MAG: selenoneine synthase SenA [Pseudomonadota bacterium]